MKRAFARFSMLPIFLFFSFTFSNSALYPINKIDVVLNEAETYLGVRWKMGGTGRKVIDCSALVQNSFKAAGFNIPRTSRDQYSWKKGIKLRKSDKYQKGDLLFFTSGGRPIGHVGIVSDVSDNRIRFIHSSSNNKKVAFDYLEGHYLKIFVGAKRLFEPIPHKEIDLFAEFKKEESTEKQENPDRELAFEWVPQFPASQDNPVAQIISENSETSPKEENLSFNFQEEEQPAKPRQKRLSHNDIRHLSPCEIRILKNTIFARYGYEFHKNPEMEAHFEDLEWYQNIGAKSRNEFYIASLFTETDKANVAFLKRHEGDCGRRRNSGKRKFRNFRVRDLVKIGK